MCVVAKAAGAVSIKTYLIFFFMNIALILCDDLEDFSRYLKYVFEVQGITVVRK